MWGASGAQRLGLSGQVTEAQYAAIYGPGGASDPRDTATWTYSGNPLKVA